jgi:hypothetical protein
MEILKSIEAEIPAQILPLFTKGKHLTFEEALEKLKDSLGKTYV